MALGYAEVSTQFGAAKAFADSATGYANGFVTQLSTMAAQLVPPTVEDALPTPPPATAPSTSALTTLAPITFIAPAAPTDSLVAPNLTVSLPSTPFAPSISDITVTTPVLPDAPTSPTFTDIIVTTPSFAAVPATPDIDTTVDLPSTPSLVLPALPLMADAVAPIEIGLVYPTDPDLYDTSIRLIRPTSYTYEPGSAYGSALLTSVKASIAARLEQSTGINPVVEQAVWDRARSREQKTAAGNVAAVTRAAESRGFALPPGALASQLREADRDYFAKQSELSRDISIKQAELEQSNAKAAIEQGIALESRLIEYANQIEQRTFDSARILAENAVAIYNAQVNEVQVLISAYQMNVAVYKAKIDMQSTRVEEYKARLAGYSTKIQANSLKIEQYKAGIAANEAIVNLYRAQLEGAKTLVEVEQLKVGIFAEQIRAYTAQVNGEVAKLEVPKVLAQLQQSRAGLYGEQVRAYSAQIGGEIAKLEVPKVRAEINRTRVEVYKAQIDGYAANASVQNANARNKIDLYDGQVRALTARFQGYAAQINGEAAKAQAQASINSSLTDRDRVLIQKEIAVYQQNAEMFRTQVSLYEAQSRLNRDRNKAQVEKYFTARTFAQEAAKVGAQVNAQLAASAFGTIRAQAGISAGQDVNFNYSGKAAFPASPA